MGVPKTRLLTLAAAQGANNWQGRQNFSARLNSFTFYNLGSVNITVTFEEATDISGGVIPPSTSLSMDTFDLYQTDILRVDFTASGIATAPTVNLIWTEGPSFIVIAKGR